MSARFELAIARPQPESLEAVDCCVWAVRRPRSPDCSRGAPTPAGGRMSNVTAAPPAGTLVPDPEHALAKDALGLPQVLFCIVTGAAPLAALLFNVPVAVSGGGYAVPAAFIVATVALTIFSVGYIEMARRVTAVGGFYTFITRGLGSVMGMGAGYLIAFCY